MTVQLAGEMTAATPAGSDIILDVRDLSVTFGSGPHEVEAVRNVSFSLSRGETLAIVGESGSGKSVTSLAILRLLGNSPGLRVRGQAFLRTGGLVTDLVSCSDREMRAIRGRHTSIIFQEPMTSLNPVHTAGDQITESIRAHSGAGHRAARERAVELLDLVGISDPRRRASAFPHELSGGMRQRVMIAMALACDPTLLIADEPTTALDVTIQAQIIELLKDIQKKTDLAMIFITHNLGVVAEVADRVMVMYSGSAVEQAGVDDIFQQPLMPYTRGLLASVPKIAFGARKKPLQAIRGNVPDPRDLPPGCAFGPRCDHFRAGLCDRSVPELLPVAMDHLARCHRLPGLTKEYGR